MDFNLTKEQLDAALAEIYTATRNHTKNGGEAVALLAYCTVLTALSSKLPSVNYDDMEEDIIRLVQFFFKASALQFAAEMPNG